MQHKCIVRDLDKRINNHTNCLALTHFVFIFLCSRELWPIDECHVYLKRAWKTCIKTRGKKICQKINYNKRKAVKGISYQAYPRTRDSRTASIGARGKVRPFGFSCLKLIPDTDPLCDTVFHLTIWTQNSKNKSSGALLI